MKKSVICDFGEKYVREPVIAKMSNGTLVCVALGGGPTEPHNENVVFYFKSYDDGETWSEPEVLFSHKQRGVWATEIYMGYDNPMMVVHTYNADCPYKELQTFVSYTYDNGEEWTVPRQIAPHANGMCIRNGIKMSNGETMFAVYYTELYDGFGDFPEFGTPNFWKGTRHMCGAVVSADNGKSYTAYGNFATDTKNAVERQANADGLVSTSVQLWEPNCVEAEDGHIIMYMRDSNRPYINSAESYDYGRTWSHIGNIDMPNADTKISLAKVNGKIVFVHNERAAFKFEERTHLCIRISDDNAKTWSEPLFVSQEDENIFYPHIYADDENKIFYIAYENAHQHYLNKYTYEELGLI